MDKEIRQRLQGSLFEKYPLMSCGACKGKSLEVQDYFFKNQALHHPYGSMFNQEISQVVVRCEDCGHLMTFHAPKMSIW